MKRLSTFSALAAAVAMTAGVATAQPIELDNIWKLDAGVESFFPTGDTVRGMALNPATGNLLVVSRSDGNLVRVVNPDTGAVTGTLPADYTGGGTFVINKVGVTDDGVIYVANLGIADGNVVVYRHADETTAPTVAYSRTGAGTAPTGRYGDGFSVIGSGNDTLLALGGAANTNAVILSTTDGENFAVDEVLAIGADTRIVKFDPTGTGLWHRTSGTGATTGYALDGSGPISGLVFDGPFPVVTGYMDIAIDANGERYHAGVPGNFGGGNSGQQDHFGDIVTLSESDTVAFRTAFGLEAGADENDPGSSNDNLNAAGDAIIDIDNERVYFLYPNNSISAWEFVIPEETAVTDWMMH